MSHYERILLATDFSEQASRAQAEAVRLARKHGAALHLVYVDVIAGQGGGAFQDPALPDYVRNVDQVSLNAFPGSAPVNYDRTVFKICRDESAVGGILRHAAEIKPDLIVLGTHGRSAIYEMVLGSVAQDVARSAPMSVLVVGASRHEASQCVLAPVDFSANSRAALDHAARIAARDGLPLVALHVVHFDRVAHPEELPIGEREHKAREDLENLLKGAQLPVAAEPVVVVAPAADAIARIAAARHAEFIVIAPSRHSALERLMLLGSVTKGVIRHAPCPVLISREPREQVSSRVAA